MYYWRISKYNPIYRDENGAYKCEEWISLGDVGNFYNGKEFSINEYLSIESSYIKVIISVLKERNIESVKVTGLEKSDYTLYDEIFGKSIRMFYDEIKDDVDISIVDIEFLVKLILREQIWAKLVSDTLSIHFGYDYYMYICSKEPINKLDGFVEKEGLFKEDKKSPYR